MHTTLTLYVFFFLSTQTNCIVLSTVALLHLLAQKDIYLGNGSPFGEEGKYFLFCFWIYSFFFLADFCFCSTYDVILDSVSNDLLMDWRIHKSHFHFRIDQSIAQSHIPIFGNHTNFITTQALEKNLNLISKSQPTLQQCNPLLHLATHS